MSCFEFEFSCRVLKSILEFDFSNSRSRILKSNFEFVFFVSSLYSISRISIFDSNFDSSFEFKFLEFSCRILNSSFSFRCSIRLLEFRFEFVVEIFVSLLNSTSRISSLYSISRISIVDSTSRFKSLEFRIRRFVSNLSSNFEFVLIYSTSRISIRICRRNCRFRVAFFI